MPDAIPTRLVVIEAAIPTGDECRGCRWEPVGYSAFCKLHGDSVGIAAEGTVLLRLPACRERDGWVAYPPGSPVAKLVEAARDMVRTEREARHMLAGAPFVGPPSYYMDRASTAANALVAAARKVAGEGER